MFTQIKSHLRIFFKLKIATRARHPVKRIVPTYCKIVEIMRPWVVGQTKFAKDRYGARGARG